MLVELEDVVNIIEHSNTVSDMIQRIKRLAYGKVYKCLNCGKEIYFDSKYNIYKHLESKDVYCNTNNANNIAIPKPERIQETPSKSPICNDKIYDEEGNLIAQAK